MTLDTSEFITRRRHKSVAKARPSHRVEALAFPDRGPQPFRRRRHVDMTDAEGAVERVDDRVHHRRRGPDGARLD
jgi:hypothetical protein